MRPAQRKYIDKDPEAYREKMRAAQKRYTGRHGDELRERRRKHRLENLEAERARGRAEYAKNKEARREASKRWKANNPDKVRAAAKKWQLRSRYGLTEEQWLEKFDGQGRACDACGSVTPRSKLGWVVDHCHTSGRTRGILCVHCNVALGKVEDSPARLQALIAYLEKHSG